METMQQQSINDTFLLYDELSVKDLEGDPRIKIALQNLYEIFW